MKQITVNLLRALVVSLAFDTSTALAQNAVSGLLTITNPAPVFDDLFGFSVATVGNDRVLIGALRTGTGASDGGTAYLFSTNGTLLTTFTNPTPSVGDFFGAAVAAVGTKRMLIGAWRDDTGAKDTGVAYLFSEDGGLITTFPNPAPAVGDYFGYSLTAVGTDKVLIGGRSAAAVYLFSTNGALLTTFTNPVPSDVDSFGWSSAAVGDYVLIGAPRDSTVASRAGAAYLFSTNGTLVTTFTNPDSTVDGQFGWSVAAVGYERVLIGAYHDDVGTTNRPGAAYFFSTNGMLLKTFTNPTPENEQTFGASVAAAGDDRLIIVGYKTDHVGNVGSGTVYVYDTNGVSLTTIANPTTAPNDYFGIGLAPVGKDRVLIGAPSNDTGVRDGGVAYLFNIAPNLTISLTSTNTVAVSWPLPWTGWALQENTNGVSSVNWSNAPGPIQDDGTNKTLIVNPPTGNRFYRLFKP